jgi:hypothetical protein
MANHPADEIGPRDLKKTTEGIPIPLSVPALIADHLGHTNHPRIKRTITNALPWLSVS